MVKKRKKGIYDSSISSWYTKKRQLKIEVYENAVISPYCYLSQAGVYEGGFKENGTPISLSKINAYTPIGNSKNKYINLDEVVVYCGGCGDTPHWGYFLVDVVSRLWYTLLYQEIDRYVIIGSNIVERKRLEGNFYEFLRLLGIEKKISILSKATKFRRVIIPEKAFDFNEDNSYHYYADEYLRTFDYVIRNALTERKEDVKKRSKKIFMTRNQKQDSGIELVNSMFVNNGFDVFDPAEISLVDLISRLQMCETVAYILGTLQHNLLFAPSGMKTIAIERKPLYSTYQIDIDKIKKLRVDYIDAHYSIVLDFNYYFGLYAYTAELKQYISDTKFEPPDIFYRTEEYCEESIKNYMKNYNMNSYREVKEEDIGWMKFVFTNYEESIKELENVFGIKIYMFKEGFFDIEKAAQGRKKLLFDLQICYREWNDYYWRTASNFFSKLISRILNKTNPRRFLIYPFGKNGMLLKQILKEQYGIEDIIIFDN